MEMKLTDPAVIKRLLGRHGTDFSKSLGQNFIIDETVCPKMASECGCDGIGVIEIGAGVGVLTAELARRAKKVVSVELDTSLLPVLAETLEDFRNVFVVNEDFLKLDLQKFIAEQFPGMPVVICANLPYYITSPIIMKILEEGSGIKSATVMVQKEAADRLTAVVGSKNSGAVTVAVDYRAEADTLFDVKRTSFLPAPKVDSAVIKLEMRGEPKVTVRDEKFFFRVVRAAFAQRRKTALNSLSAGLCIDKSKIAAALSECGLQENIRPEALGIETLARLSDKLL